MLMPSSTTAPARFASIISATAVLMLPALWNRFPLLEYDTGGYLARWFEGYLVPSRPTTYGIFLLSGWPLDFWPVVILQAAAAVWIVGLVLRLYRLILALYGLCSAEFADLGGLAATLTLALLADAAFCAVISHSQDRYGSRLAWIAVFTVSMALWRAISLARQRTTRLSRESVSTV
jgi:hypothetical protein